MIFLKYCYIILVIMIHIQGIHDQIDGLDDFVSVGWIGVNMKPAKHLVCALITKWIYVYTNFLTKQVCVYVCMYVMCMCLLNTYAA